MVSASAQPIAFGSGYDGVRTFHFVGRPGLEAVRALYSATSPDPDRFEATITSVHPARVAMNYGSATPSRFFRDAARMSQTPIRTLNFGSTVRGAGYSVEQEGHPRSMVGPGQATVLLDTRNWEVHNISADVLMVHITVPLADIDLPEAALDELLGQVLPATPLTTATTQFMSTVAAGLPDPGTPAAAYLDRALLDMLQAVLAEAVGGAMPRVEEPGLRLQIRQYILDNLWDPHLGVAGVAAHFGVPRSRVERLFTSEALTVAEFTREARLSEAARALRTQGDTVLIADVARTWGFGGADQLTRSFPRRYGMTPSMYREIAASKRDH